MNGAAPDTPRSAPAGTGGSGSTGGCSTALSRSVVATPRWRNHRPAPASTTAPAPSAAAVPRKRRRVTAVIGAAAAPASPVSVSRARRASHTSTAAATAPATRLGTTATTPLPPRPRAAATPTSVNTPTPTRPARVPRRSASTPTPAAKRANSTITPPTSTALSEVPNQSIAQSFTGRGTLSTTRSPTLSTGDCTEVHSPVSSSATASPDAAATMPSNAPAHSGAGADPTGGVRSVRGSGDVTASVCSGGRHPRGSLGLIRRPHPRHGERSKNRCASIRRGILDPDLEPNDLAPNEGAPPCVRPDPAWRWWPWR